MSGYEAMIQEVWFASDSALEGDGFEPSVPVAKEPVGRRFLVYWRTARIMRHVGSDWRIARRSAIREWRF